MASISIRQLLERNAPASSGGILTSTEFHRSFRTVENAEQGWKVTAHSARPYKSLRSRIDSLLWPEGEVVRSSRFDYPANQEPEWSNKCQGVAHDEHHWYFVQNEQIDKVPVSQDLNQEHESVASVEMKVDGYDHYGDSDFFEGHLYVALEGDKDRPGQPRIAVFNEHLDFIGSELIITPEGDDRQAGAPWCAIHPGNGLLYTSSFHGHSPWKPQPTKALIINVFKPHIAAGRFTLTYLGRFSLVDEKGQPGAVNRIQGGAFSPAGHLYLVSDMPSGGIVGVDVASGQIRMRCPIDYKPFKFMPHIPPDSVWERFSTFFKEGRVEGPETHIQLEELEGITVWDLNSGRAPGIQGQLHLVMLYKQPDSDNVAFMHFATRPQTSGQG